MINTEGKVDCVLNALSQDKYSNFHYHNKIIYTRHMCTVGRTPSSRLDCLQIF